MNDVLIGRVTGEENGQMRLEEIERQGLFLQRMDDTGEWFSYHPLFGSFYASAASGNCLRNYRRSTALRRKLDGTRFPQRGDSSCAGGGRCANVARYPA